MAFAETTSVPVERTVSEIQRMLERAGATHYAYMTRPGGAVVCFRHTNLTIKIDFAVPARDEKRFTIVPNSTWQERSADGAIRAWEQAVRSRYPAIMLVIKAKLEAISAGISTVENEFMPYVVLGDGKTIGDHVQPAIAAAREGRPPLLALPLGT